ncbi:MAG: ATP-grasp domain-containing protein [Methanobrevibacter sp.]|jgi:carbamoylphosphate synthase large subunit|nr:ATP-grasp domain-containing protein [Candidatus Methanovirga procula]
MKKILLIINDIDPNIYLNGITEDFDLYVIYVIPKSSAMKKKFKECINKHQSVSWIAVASEEIVLQEIKNYSHKEKFDMIIAYDEDGIIPIEKMKRDLGLLNQYENIKDICDKAYQRKTISKKYPELSGGCFEIEHIKDLNFFPDNFKFPAVLKPVSLSGSRYVIKIEDYSDLIVKFKEICNKNEQKCKYIVEEEFIGTDWYDSCNIYGDYVSVESIVSFGKITHLAICDKTPIVYPFREETGLIFPSMLDEQKQKLLFQSAEKIIKALKYNFGPTHIEFKLTANGPKFIEFNPRAGGPIPIQIQLSSKYNIIKRSFILLR